MTTKWSQEPPDVDFGRREKEPQEVHWRKLLHPGDGQTGASVMRLGGKNSNEAAATWAVIARTLKQLDARLGSQQPPVPTARRPEDREKEIADLRRENHWLKEIVKKRLDPLRVVLPGDPILL